MAKISGNISNDSRIIVVKETDWVVESNTNKTAGAFEITGLDFSKKTVIARATSGECAGYGDVTPVTEEV